MILARVKGNLVSTQKNKFLVGYKLLLTQKMDLNGNLIGDEDQISLDLVDAGIGDIVIVVHEGDAVKQILGHDKAPVNSMIIAIVDNIEISYK